MEQGLEKIKQLLTNISSLVDEKKSKELKSSITEEKK